MKKPPRMGRPVTTRNFWRGEVRLPPTIGQQVRDIAKTERRSINQTLIILIERGLTNV